MNEPMQTDWYIDFISPFAYLQSEQLHLLPPTLAIAARPIVFGALLSHHGHKGPAEIESKRRFTYRNVLWQAQRLGIPFRFPAAHPFNPLPLLRLAIAAGSSVSAVQTIFRFVWAEGRTLASDADLDELGLRVGVPDAANRIASDAVKQELRANTDAAIAHGVFGVPTLACGDELFWGADATAMFTDWLAGTPLFSSPEMQRVSALPIGLMRTQKG